MRIIITTLLLLSSLSSYAYKPKTKDVNKMYNNNWSVTSLGIGGSGNHQLSNKARMVVDFNHYSAWKYGYHDLRIDYINPGKKDYVIATQYKPSLSLTKSNRSGVFRFPILDVSLAGHFSWNELKEREFGAGVEVHLVPPALGHYLIFGAYGVKNLEHRGGNFLLHIRTKFTLVRGLMFKLNIDGYPRKQTEAYTADDASEKIAIRENVKIEGSFLLDVGTAWGSRNKAYVVPYVSYWMNKLGRDNVNETAFGVKLLFTL